ncbi:MAG: insulinase family protein [Oscillospiraceae bacterium]|nr:insulinase family protein [Oscillospiraceae bacterium]
MRQIRNEILPGVYLTCLQTEKFKTGLLSVSFLTRLCREEAAQNTLIPSVLRRGTTSHPDMEALADRLDSLYGARIEPISRKLGEIQAAGFWASFADDAWLPEGGTSLLEDTAALLGELILSPNTRGGLLLPAYVESEKEKLLEDIRARVNDKIAYSRLRLTELMCAAEDYAVDVLGTEDTAESIGYVALTKRYKRLLSTAPVEIFYCGAADAARVEAALMDAFMPLPRGEIDYELGTDVRMNALEDHVRYHTETMDVTQGKLVIGWRLGLSMEDPDPAVLRVMNTVFGGGVHSKLFRNVREKLSLCYYAGSGIDLMKGFLFVSCGIEPEKYDEALQAILRQLEAMRAGEITEEELAGAKASLVSDLTGLSDNPGQLESFWLSQNLLGLEYGPEELAALVEDVTAEQVSAAARAMECDMVYFMTCSGEENEDA